MQDQSANLSVVEPENPLLPHYVYLLLDPTDGNVPFYVGKGQGMRAFEHVEEVKREMAKNESELEQEQASPDAYEHPKKIRIAKLLALKTPPLALIVARFESAAEAFAVESVLIHLVYGHDNLTNSASGHGSSHMRSLAELKHIQENCQEQNHIPPKDNVDCRAEKDPSLRDGTFRDKKVQDLSAAGAYDLLQNLQNKLSDAGLDWRDFSGAGDRNFDPGESNGQLATIVTIGGIDFRIGFAKTKAIGIVVLNTSNSQTEEARNNLLAIEKAMGANYRLQALVNGGRYARFEKFTKFSEAEIDEVIALLNAFKACCRYSV